MDESNTPVAKRIALNRGVPSFSVLMLTITSSIFAFVFFIIALVMKPRISVVALGCVVILFALWWQWNGNRRRSTYDWEGLAFLEQDDGKITFVPDRGMRSIGYRVADAPFPIGSRLEYHIETGDRYFTGDHAQVLRRSLWTVEPTGTKHQLLDSAANLNLAITIKNLRSAAVPFRVVKIYDGQEGEHTEANVTEEYVGASKKVWNRAPSAILIGTSSLWLGALAGVFVHNAGYLTAIGVLGFVAIATLLLRFGFSKRTAFIELLTLIPSYATAYVVVVLIIRNISAGK